MKQYTQEEIESQVQCKQFFMLRIAIRLGSNRTLIICSKLLHLFF